MQLCRGLGGTAATHGARVLSLDVSAPALRAVELNAQRNGVGDAVSTLRGDAFDALRELRAAGERYDVLMVDPPAFIKRRKDLKQGTLAYRRLNQLALQLLEREGGVDHLLLLPPHVARRPA